MEALHDCEKKLMSHEGKYFYNKKKHEKILKKLMQLLLLSTIFITLNELGIWVYQEYS